MASNRKPSNKISIPIIGTLVFLATIIIGTGVFGQKLQDPFQRVNYFMQNQSDSAQILAEAILASKGIVDSTQAKANYYLGVIHYYQGRNYVSADYYRRAIATEYAGNNPLFLGKCYNNLGIVLDITEQYNLAIENYLKSMEIDLQLGDSAGVAQSKINIGLLFINMLQLDQSEIYLNEAKQYFERNHDLNGLALVYHNFAVLQKLRNQPDSSLVNLEKAAQLYSEAGNDYEYVNILIHLTTNYQSRGDLDKAQENIHMAQKKANELGFEFFSSQAQLVYAGLLLDMGDFVKAQQIINTIETINPHQEDDRRILNLKLVNRIGKPVEFNEALDNFLNYHDSVFVQDNNRIVNEINLKYKTEKRLAKIQQQSSIIINQRSALFLALGFFILLISLLIIIILDHRKLRRSHQIIFRKLNEQSQKPLYFTDNLVKLTEEIEEKDQFELIWKSLNKLMINDKLFLKTKVTIDEIANSCSTNKTYIYKAIKLFTNESFNYYINSYRVKEAQGLLKDYNKYDVNSIAELSGFNAPSSFYRIFREHTGLTPSQYRMLARKDERKE